MKRKLIKLPSPSMAVALVALFVALGGSAYAIGKNTVGTKQLKNNAVTSKKIKAKAVTEAKLSSGLVPARAWVTIDGATEAIEAEGGLGVTSVAQGTLPGWYCIEASFQPSVVVAQDSTNGDTAWSSTFAGAAGLTCPSGTEASVQMWTQGSSGPEVAPTDLTVLLF